jgi:hypothetical protein
MPAKSKRGGLRRPSGGRPPKPLTALAAVSGKVRVRIDPAQEMIIPVDVETRALAQRLMLRQWPGVERVEQLYAYAIRRLAETTDD